LHYLKSLRLFLKGELIPLRSPSKYQPNSTVAPGKKSGTEFHLPAEQDYCEKIGLFPGAKAH
jgi:hypothetical protein